MALEPLMSSPFQMRCAAYEHCFEMRKYLLLFAIDQQQHPRDTVLVFIYIK
jgi:hypothetical protein